MKHKAAQEILTDSTVLNMNSCLNHGSHRNTELLRKRQKPCRWRWSWVWAPQPITWVRLNHPQLNSDIIILLITCYLFLITHQQFSSFYSIVSYCLFKIISIQRDSVAPRPVCCCHHPRATVDPPTCARVLFLCLRSSPACVAFAATGRIHLRISCGEH